MNTQPLWKIVHQSYKATHSLTLPSRNCAPMNLPKYVENLYLHKKLHIKFGRNFIHNCKATKMCFNTLIVKHSYILTIRYYSVVDRNELFRYKK